MWGTGLLKGLLISLRNWRRGPITVQYPYEKLELPERSRWAVRPKYFADGSPRCTACLACVRVCPDHILGLDVETREDKSKHIDRFSYELGACMMCGLCVESCPFDAICMSHEYELATTDRGALNENLLENVDAASAARHKAEREAAEVAGSGSAAEAASPSARAEGGEDGV
ncbi:MAG: NuoI/complex I 23 kDa subunit family protein [Coriobacteriia bacterium]